VLVTSLLDAPVELIVALYRYRWLIELFFRWLKSVMSCRHLMSQALKAIEIQVCCALIAFLRIQLAAGCNVRSTAWTYKLLCLYEQGWATEAEVLAQLRELERKEAMRATRG
jgi:IS4 transposase